MFSLLMPDLCCTNCEVVRPGMDVPVSGTREDGFGHCPVYDATYRKPSEN